MAERKQPESLWQRIVGAGEERLGQFAEEILQNPHVTDALAAALRRAARTKGQVDKNMQLLLSALNLPTKNDLTKLTSKIEALQGSLVNINIKLDRLLAERQQQAAAERPAPQRAPRMPRARKPAGEDDAAQG
ncbi:MAG TPA: hypothetical protein VIS07_01695 [Candidatus Binatia bacterium]